MTPKDHYEKLLGKVYSWMMGDFQKKMLEQKNFFLSNGITPGKNRLAFDLGCGNGIQTIALADIGFRVQAVDFHTGLLQELATRAFNLPITIHLNEITTFLNETSDSPELIVCMGDTITHLESRMQVETVISAIVRKLPAGGKAVFSFRDLSEERHGPDRFIPVRSDDSRAMLCFLEYFPQHVLVHDIVLEKEGDVWKQNIGSYPKLRLAVDDFKKDLFLKGLSVNHHHVDFGMHYIICEKG